LRPKFRKLADGKAPMPHRRSELQILGGDVLG
jgi:hypothetical protein